MKKVQKVDVLCICAHPDDVELSFGGTVAKMTANKKKVGIIDLTQGEMGTRGNILLREKEAMNAAKILNVSFRVNCKMEDAWFEVSQQNLLQLITLIRVSQPHIVLTNANFDRHLDHIKTGDMVERAVFLSGLPKIETEYLGESQSAFRPPLVFRGLQAEYVKPDIVVDITPYWETKLASLKAFESQFFDPKSSEPETFISTPHFFNFVEARAREMGTSIRVEYGEGFTSQRSLGISDLFHLI